MTAFEKFLISIPHEQAVAHVIDCLIGGSSSNEAWELMRKYNGEDWSVSPKNLVEFVSQTIHSLQVGEAS